MQRGGRVEEQRREETDREAEKGREAEAEPKTRERETKGGGSMRSSVARSRGSGAPEATGPGTRRR